MSIKRKHSSCSLKEKLEVLRRLDSGESAAKLAVEFGVGHATISDWKKNRTKIEHFCATASPDILDRRQTSRVSSFDKVNEALFLWFQQERDNGTTLSGTLIQEKALQLNNLLDGDPSFTASNGWLHRWKKRHGVCQLAPSYKKSPPDEAAVEEYKVHFNNMLPSSSDSDDCSHHNYADSNMVSLAQQAKHGGHADSVEKDAVELENEQISHIEGAAALEVALRYVERHSKVTPADVVFLKRWRDIAASSLFSSLRQRKLMAYIVKKDL